MLWPIVIVDRPEIGVTKFLQFETLKKFQLPPGQGCTVIKCIEKVKLVKSANRKSKVGCGQRCDNSLQKIHKYIVHGCKEIFVGHLIIEP